MSLIVANIIISNEIMILGHHHPWGVTERTGEALPSVGSFRMDGLTVYDGVSK